MTKQGVVQVKSVNGRRIEFTASHEKVDRDSELVIVKGIDTAEFLKNPVLCLQHDTRQTAVARVVSLRKTVIDGAPALVGIAEFPDRPSSNEALADVKAGLLNAVSIGFKVLERGGPILPGQTGTTYIKTLLLEISLVTLPACPTCLITAKSTTSCGCKSALSGEELLVLDDGEIVCDEDVAQMAREAIGPALCQVVREATRREINYLRGRID